MVEVLKEHEDIKILNMKDYIKKSEAERIQEPPSDCRSACLLDQPRRARQGGDSNQDDRDGFLGEPRT